MLISSQMLASRRALLLAGSSLAFVALPAQAFAQDAPPPAAVGADETAPENTAPTPPPAAAAGEGDIVVTGFRRSVRDSIEIKRRERAVVEAVSAEEIGKLPDVSVAESIARLPGLTAQRVAGRAQIISVRGFSPDFTTVLLNGRQQASSGFNRAVEFDQYPSELLSSVVVYKSPDASVAGMGLAGTVDLRTVRPLAYGKKTIAMNLRGTLDEGGGRNDDMSKYGWRGTVAYIDQNAAGTVGWSLGYAHLDAPGHTNHTKNWFYDNYAGLFDPASTYYLSGQEARAYNRRDIRDGIMGTLEVTPTDHIHSVLDLYYSRFKQHEIMRGAEWFSDAWADGVTYDNVETDGEGRSVSGHVNNAVPILRWDDNKRKDKLFSAALNNEFEISDRTKLIADLSYSSNKRDETFIETYGGYGAGPFQTRTFDEYDFEIDENGHPQFTNWGLDYADANQVSLGDRAPWGGWGHDGLKNQPHIKETITAGDGAVVHKLDWGPFSTVEAGINFTHRRKTKTVDEHNLFLKNGRQQVLIDPQFITGNTSLDFAGMWDLLGVQIGDALSTYYDEQDFTDQGALAAHYDKAWKIDEDITTFKAKANIDSGDLHGNVGLQVVRQKQTSSGLRINTTVNPLTLSPIEVTDTYTDWLPSLNLFYDITNEHRVRLAAAKVMMRPRMDDMRANMVPGFNSAVCAGSPGCTPGQEVHPWSAGGGNPNLQPWRAKELDVAYEWYGGKASYFSINAFYMWLDNYIYTQVIPGDFSGFPLPPEASLIPDNVIISPIGTLSAPANGDGGYVRGVEVSGAFELGRITPLLEGFGAQGSVSYSKYKLDSPDALVTFGGVLPGFSKWVYNVTGYYERNGFQARASYRYRSAFRGEVVSLFANLGFPGILADRQMDAQVGYTFQPGSRLENLGIVLQVSNLLNSPYRTSYDVNGARTLETFEKYGRQWILGASYHF